MTLDMLVLLGAETAAEAAKESLGTGTNFYCPAGLLCINGTLIFQAINFFVFVAILNFVFFKPLFAVIDDRENYLLSNRRSAQEQLDQAKALAAQYEAELVDSRREAQEVILKAEAEAQKIRVERLTQVQTEAAELLDRARIETAKERERALSSLQAEVATLSAQVTSKLLSRVQGR